MKNCDPTLLQLRQVHAKEMDENPPRIDGRLDDEAWQGAEVAERFVQIQPEAGAEAKLRTEARVGYDNYNLYVAMRMYDPMPSQVVAPYVRRDDETNCDWAFVEIDSRHDRKSAFSFGLNPRGVQADGAWVSDTEYDPNWDAVWEGAAVIDAEGWSAEFRIPLSQLPYAPGTSKPKWGLNFYRSAPRHGEVSVWAPRGTWLAGVVSRFNELSIPAPAVKSRYEFSPYVAAGGQFGYQEGQAVPSRTVHNLGADFRVGLSEGFHLVGAIHPDFGQVEADPAQLILTSFELFQAERRPFFLQGMDIFRIDTSAPFTTRDDSFASETAFYSRRVGRTPRGIWPRNGALLNAPSATRILSALKLNGQTSRGLTVGAFTAVTSREHVTLRNDKGRQFTSPIEPYGLTSVLRTLKSYRDSETLVGAHVTLVDHLAMDMNLANQFVRTAAVAGVEGRHRFAAKTYELSGWFEGTWLTGNKTAMAAVMAAPHHYLQRPDSSEQSSVGQATSLSGWGGQFHAARVAGDLQWSVYTRMVSPGYDVNETGFQRNSDWKLLGARWRLQKYPLGRLIRHWFVGSNRLGMGWDWNGRNRAKTIDFIASVDTHNFWNITWAVTHDFEAYSHEWLRGGPSLLVPPRDTIELSAITDIRKSWQFQIDAKAYAEFQIGSTSLALSPSATAKQGDHLAWTVGLTYQRDHLPWQYAGSNTTQYVVARLRQVTVSPILRTDYAFSSKLILQLYLQPFASSGTYDRYKLLSDPEARHAKERFALLDPAQILHRGRHVLLDLNGDGRPDLDPVPSALERQLNVNLVLRWEFRPGAFLTGVWSMTGNREQADTNPGIGTIGHAFTDPASKTLLLKINYYIHR